MTKMVGVIQARIGSTRLANKMLLHLNGYAVVQWVILRASKAKLLDRLVVASPDGLPDDPLVEYLERLEVEIIRGSEQDVLGRFITAARATEAENIVRICADNPLISWEAIDLLIREHYDSGADYTYNHLPRRNLWPDGLGAEACTRQTLAEIYENATAPDHREHAFNYLWDHKDQFNIHTFEPPHPSWHRPELKLDIDTWDDFRKIQRLDLHPDMTIDELMERIGKADE